MKEKIDLEFCFKGSRTYVHGTDIYNVLIEKLDGKISQGMFDLSFHGVAQENLTLQSEKPHEDEIKFACKYITAEGTKKTLYGKEDGREVKCRYEYPEENICHLSRLNLSNNEVNLMEATSFSFIENTVALNKYLLENLFPDVLGKWYFTRLQLKKIFIDAEYPLKLVLKANFNFKLTKSEIFIKDTSVGFVYFSLV